MPVTSSARRRPLLGVFDSGLGGLTVARRLRALAPSADLLYFADQLHVPYGDRSVADLRGLLASNVGYLAGQGVDAIVMGCNTSCAVAARHGWPDASVPILDLIGAAARAVVASGAKRICVLATTATARSGAYADAIRSLDPEISVRELAAPALVPLVEAGVTVGPVARDAVAAICRDLGSDVDAVVLACTHYPLLDAEFAAVLGDAVVRIDPALAQAESAAAWLRERAPDPGDGGGTARYVTNGSLSAFHAGVEAVTPLRSGDVVELRGVGLTSALR